MFAEDIMVNTMRQLGLSSEEEEQIKFVWSLTAFINSLISTLTIRAPSQASGAKKSVERYMDCCKSFTIKKMEDLLGNNLMKATVLLCCSQQEFLHFIRQTLPSEDQDDKYLSLNHLYERAT